MKKTKFLGFFAILFGCVAAFAFTPAPAKNEGRFDISFELVENGVKTERTHWVPALPDEECDTPHSDDPCRITADNDNGNPAEDDFLEILSESDDFEDDYPARVTYYQP